VKRIITRENRVTGILTADGDTVTSRYVISNCDAHQTFTTLLGRNTASRDFLEDIGKMTPSLSAFILYLGVDEPPFRFPPPGTNIWVLSHKDFSAVHSVLARKTFHGIGGYLTHLSSDKKSLISFVNVPFLSKSYWDENKTALTESLIRILQADIAPGLTDHVVHQEAATPYTLFRYTMNWQGAAFGWAVSPSHLALPDFRKPSFVQGLYLCGHWTTRGLGISGVGHVGYDTARMILQKEKSTRKSGRL
jgi:prolycopene isomerase